MKAREISKHLLLYKPTLALNCFSKATLDLCAEVLEE